jgi:hypothetical protein
VEERLRPQKPAGPVKGNKRVINIEAVGKTTKSKRRSGIV